MAGSRHRGDGPANFPCATLVSNRLYMSGYHDYAGAEYAQGDHRLMHAATALKSQSKAIITARTLAMRAGHASPPARGPQKARSPAAETVAASSAGKPLVAPIWEVSVDGAREPAPDGRDIAALY